MAKKSKRHLCEISDEHCVEVAKIWSKNRFEKYSVSQINYRKGTGLGLDGMPLCKRVLMVPSDVYRESWLDRFLEISSSPFTESNFISAGNIENNELKYLRGTITPLEIIHIYQYLNQFYDFPNFMKEKKFKY